jgi:hypothetical protein
LYAPRLTLDQSDSLEKFTEVCGDVAGWWCDDLNPETKRIHRLVVKILGNHVALEGCASAGSLDPLAFTNFLDRYESLVSFCRLGNLAETACCYVSLRENGTRACFGAFVEVLATAVSGFPSQEVHEAFQLAEREGLLPWSVELPAAFVP